MSLNSLKMQKVSRNQVDWIELSYRLSEFSKSLKTNNKITIEKELIYCIEQNIDIANNYNINLDKAWEKWDRKAKSKVYY